MNHCPLKNLFFSATLLVIMTIHQTIDIPADRRVFFDLPFAPVGRAKVEITITPETETPAPQTAGKEAGKWVNPLWGRAKALGCTLTMDRFMEMQREDIELEIEQEDRLFGRIK
ncbi:hypothetical protein FACS1894190_11200 [Spirochaetia bacterium]|nr:hypothetical protein FACS1894190_11200 [Spirochaetia bacterium]